MQENQEQIKTTETNSPLNPMEAQSLEQSNNSNQEQENVKQIKPNQAPTIVKFDSNGMLEFSNNLELRNCAVYANLFLPNIPTSIKKEGIEAVMAALVFCKQHQLKWDAINHLMYVRGKILPYGKLYTALAQRHPNFGQIRVFVLDEKQEDSLS